jgi:hypothetical protein
MEITNYIVISGVNKCINCNFIQFFYQ